jgi:predicted alpha/beta superfamily hydrolase
MKLTRVISPLFMLLFPLVPCGHSRISAAQGKMEFLTLHSRVFSNTRTIRIWLPPGYHDPAQRNRRYPVFYFTDGIAAFNGRKLDKVAARLVAAGKIPPTIFVGIDNGGSTRESKNPGSDRANEYLPYPDDSLVPPVPNPQGQLFPPFLEKEVRPLVESRYRTNGEAGLAGASYGGAISVYTAMENPGRYKWLLIESPSLYIADDILLRNAEKFQHWPARIYVGAGTNEGEGDAKREMVDDARRFANSLSLSVKTCFVLVPGAAHSESAWRARLPAALAFLLGGSACPAAP